MLLNVLNNINNIQNRKQTIDTLFKIQHKVISCVIDDIEFTIAGKTYLDKDIVHIISKTKSGEENNIVFYRSNSEMGFWRLGFWPRGWSGFHKGSDYVTSTFIHIELQKFINDHFDGIYEYDADTFVNGDMGKYINYDSKTYIANPNRFDILFEDKYKDRISDDKYFNFLRNCKSAYCFSSNQLTDKTFKTFAALLDRITNDSPDYEKFFKEKFDNNCATAKQNINNINTNHIECLYKTISEFMEKYFIVLGNKRTVGDFYFKNDKMSLDTTIQVYSILIKNVSENKKYKLYYGYYNFQSNNYKMIINIVPIESKIHKFGIYDKIVSAGVYIYKCFEYTKQCDIKSKECYDGYYFIGNYISNVWPLNKL